MTPPSPRGEGAGNSEDWMKVLDRFLDAGTQDGGDLFQGGRETSDDYFLFTQQDGSLFQDPNTNATHWNSGVLHSSSRNRFSSVSLSSLLHNNHETNNQETGAYKSDDGTSHENLQNTQIQPQEPDTAQKKNDGKTDAASAFPDDDMDADEEDDADDLEYDSATPGGLNEQKARYERKRNLEKRRRLDTRSQFDALAATLRDYEQEFLVEDGSDPDSDTSPNDELKASQDDPKRPKVLPFSFKSSTNRLDVISRAISALNRLQGDVRKLKKDKKALKKVVIKLNALSSDTQGSTRPVAAAAQQGSAMASHPAPTVQGIGPLHAVGASSVMDMAQIQSAHMMHTMPSMMFPYNSQFPGAMFVPMANFMTHPSVHPYPPTAQPMMPNPSSWNDVNLFVPNATVFPVMPVQQNYLHRHQVPMMHPQQAAVSAPEQNNMHHPYSSLAYHVPYTVQHPATSHYIPTPDMVRVEANTYPSASTQEPTVRSPVLQGQPQTLPVIEDAARHSSEDTHIDPSQGVHLAHCA